MGFTLLPTGEIHVSAHMNVLFSVLTIVSFVYCGLVGSSVSTASENNPETGIGIQSASQFVVVDQSDPAYIVFTGIPNKTDKKKLEQIRSTVAGQKGLSMLTLEQFLNQIKGFAGSVIIRNDYSDGDVVAGLVCLLASELGAGAPWGLTWNGGVALTYNDYRHARQRYELYRKDPASYKPIQDPRKDPVNPRGHLSLGGCN